MLLVRRRCGSATNNKNKRCFMINAGFGLDGLDKYSADELSEIAQRNRKPGSKGYVRRCLSQRVRFLVAALKEGLTLSDIRELLSKDSVFVSIASVRSFLMADLPDEYREYLKVNGRGRLKYRGGADASVVTHSVVENYSSRKGVSHPREEKISNPGDLRNSLKNSILDEC